MNRIKQTLLVSLALAGVMSVFTQCGSKGGNASDVAIAEGANSELLPVAYVDVDSLINHLDFYLQLVDGYERELSKQNESLNAAGRKLQNEAIAFQQKVQNNAFLSRERAEQEQTRIQRMQADLEKRADQVQQDLAVKQRNIQQQLQDSLLLGIKEFNTPQKYQMIITKSATLYADERYNITAEVTDYLNKRFK
jgi:outer membrane protein